MGLNIEVKSRNGYSPSYIEYCFWTWYGAGRPAMSDLILHIDSDDKGHKPQTETLYSWRNEFNWLGYADTLDEEVREKVRQQYVNDKAKMLAKHAALGRTLQEKGMQYLENNELKSPHAAIRAVELGIMIERDSSNLEKLLDTVSKMDDPKLMTRLDKMLSKVNLKPKALNDSNVEEEPSD